MKIFSVLLLSIFFAFNVHADTTCDAGLYLDGDVCTACPAGYYCTGAAATKTACPEGTYNDALGATDATACKTIENGKYGTGCVKTGGRFPTITACNGIAECPELYRDGVGAKDINDCQIKATPGTYVATAGAGLVECPEGSYCPGDIMVNYNATGGRTGCGIGKYNDTTGATDASACKNVPDGNYGSNCIGGRIPGCAAYELCPELYRDGLGARNIDYCQIKTTPGTYVATAGAGLVECPAGAYCPGDILVNYNATGGIAACPADTYLDSDTLSCVEIGIGKYCSATDSGTGGCTGVTDCPDGYRDGPGAMDINNCQIKTMPDTYVDAAGAGLVPCPNWAYCPGNILVNYNATGGYLSCPTGTYMDLDKLECVEIGIGKYCNDEDWMTGSCTGVTDCPDGYRDGPGVMDINNCQVKTTPGTYVDTAGAGLVECPVGYYCPGDVMVNYNATGGNTQCNIYTYSDTVGSTECKEIEQGYFCSDSIRTGLLWGYGCYAIAECPDGYRDGVGAVSINSCQIKTTPGTYVATSGAGLVECPAGAYCPGDIMVGYSSTGGIVACPAGTYLDSDTLSCLEIGVGKYCSVTDSDTGGCIGVTDCPNGYRDGVGVTDINSCQVKATPGTYVATARAGLSPCPAGYYCPGNVTLYYNATGVSFACPEGTYNDTTSATDESQCKAITPGNYGAECNYRIGGRVPKYIGCEASVACPDGYRDGVGATSINYCQIRTKSGTYVATAGAGLVTGCPAGYYCPGNILIDYNSTGGNLKCVHGWNANVGACARTINFKRPGDTTPISIILDTTKRTTPALATRVHGETDIYYANMMPVGNTKIPGAVHIAYGGQNYILADNKVEIEQDPKFWITTTPTTSSFGFNMTAMGEFTVDWGDGTIEEISRTDTTSQQYSHTYASAGTYTIGLGGRATGYSTNDSSCVNFFENGEIAGILGSLGAIFPTLGDGLANQPSFYNLFMYCDNLQGTIPADLFKGVYGTPRVNMFRSVFYRTKISGSIPDGLFGNLAGAPAESMFVHTFALTPNLTGPTARMANGTRLYDVMYNGQTWQSQMPSAFDHMYMDSGINTGD